MKPKAVRDVFFRMRAQHFPMKQISGVSRTTLFRWNKVGPVSSLRQIRPNGRSRKLDNSMTRALLAHIKANNTITHRQAAEWLLDTFSVRVSMATVRNYCKRLNLTCKKATKAFTEMDEQKAELWLQNIAVGFGPHVIALDEAAFVYHHVRGYAWSENVKWQIYEGAITAADIIEFLQALPSGSKLVLDNCQIHKATDVLTKQNLPTASRGSLHSHLANEVIITHNRMM